MSAFIHGVLLLLAALFIPKLLNLTPLAALAAVLLSVGFKLTKPKIFKDIFAQGMSQFLPFIVTVAAIVATDLLKGVLIGIFFGLFFVIRTNHHDALTVVNQDNYYLMRFNKDASFVNKNEIRSQLRALPEGAHVIIDGTKALYVDHDIADALHDFSQLAPYKNITVELRNI